MLGRANGRVGGALFGLRPVTFYPGGRGFFRRMGLAALGVLGVLRHAMFLVR